MVMMTDDDDDDVDDDDVWGNCNYLLACRVPRGWLFDGRMVPQYCGDASC